MGMDRRVLTAALLQAPTTRVSGPAPGGYSYCMTRGIAHPVFARLYAFLSARAEGGDISRNRRATLQGLHGHVLEVGAGNGLMFPHYPPTVDRVVATEPEDYLRRRAVRAAQQAPVPVAVDDSRAEHLPFPDGAFDAVVFALVLCSVDDPPAALAEARRVLAPGGEVRFFEHVRPRHGWKRGVAERLDSWGIFPRLAGGCHLARDTDAAIARAGFAIEAVDEVDVDGQALPVPFIRGVARSV
jgi:ubiquinone/menaquinone biosynthesis C-methylase UbiE